MTKRSDIYRKAFGVEDQLRAAASPSSGASPRELPEPASPTEETPSHSHECISNSRARCMERGYCECECGFHWNSYPASVPDATLSDSPQTALMLGSKLDPNDKTIDWEAECATLRASHPSSPTELTELLDKYEKHVRAWEYVDGRYGHAQVMEAALAVGRIRKSVESLVEARTRELELKVDYITRLEISGQTMAGQLATLRQQSLSPEEAATMISNENALILTHSMRVTTPEIFAKLRRISSSKGQK